MTEQAELTASPTSSQPLFKLPTKVRLKIYEFVFHETIACVRIALASTEWRQYGGQPQILLTCRLCYYEARKAFYATTIWQLDCVGARDHCLSTNHGKFRDIQTLYLSNLDLINLSFGILPSLRSIILSVKASLFSHLFANSLWILSDEDLVQCLTTGIEKLGSLPGYPLWRMKHLVNGRRSFNVFVIVAGLWPCSDVVCPAGASLQGGSAF
jgi:hypothetical protein